MPGIVIIIPTYWTWPTGGIGKPDDVVYDHPTPLDQPGTLPRLLESLSAIGQPQFSVIVITAVTDAQLEAKAEARIEEITAPFRDTFPIAQFAAGDLLVLRQRMEQLGFSALAPLISLRGYGYVRNIQLIVSHILGGEVIVALDDDEVVESDYLARAIEFIEREHEGQQVLGLAGFYLDSEGNLLLPERPPTENIFLDKSAIMNEATRRLLEMPGRLVETPIALGGNMVFHRDLFTRVSFDPNITRGEDIDYAMNARLMGFSFWLDKELTITHLPPEAYGAPPYAKLIEDVYRFVYEREKLRLAQQQPGLVKVTVESLDPYPGRFLRDDVLEQALGALQAEATPEAVARYGSPENVAAAAKQCAVRTAPRYFPFAQAWPPLMEALGRDTSLREHLLAQPDYF